MADFVTRNEVAWSCDWLGTTEQGLVRVDYDAFISYNRGDAAVAARLQRLIRRVGRPWHERATLRVFRDKTSLRLSPSLRQALKESLDRADSLVLIASPESARSEWVRFEVGYWCENRDRDKLFIVHSGGEISWGGEDFVRTENTAVPPALYGWFTEEPLWGSAADEESLRDAALSIASRLYGVEKDRLRDDDEIERRKTKRAKMISRVVIAVAVVGLLAAGVFGLRQVGETGKQEQIALARRLAGASESRIGSDLDVANLLAVKAFRTDPNSQTRAALFRANSASGSLVRYLPFDADVTRIVASGDGGAIVAGLTDGRVLRWRLAEKAPELLTDLDGELTALAVSSNADVVVAADKSTARVLRAGREPQPIAVELGTELRGAAVSPSGRTAVVTSDNDSAVATVLRLGDDISRSDHVIGGLTSVAPSLAVTSDDEVVLLDSGYGDWTRYRLDGWATAFKSSAGFGTANYGQAISADGGAFTYTNGAKTIPVWNTDSETAYEEPHRTAHASISKPGAMALSADASHVAIAEDGAIYVSAALPAGSQQAELKELSGTGQITTHGLAFLGTDHRRLASASGNRVTLWDLEQTDRISRTFGVPLGSGCNACGPPVIALSDDGARMIAVDGGGWSGVVGPVAEPTEFTALPKLGFDALYGPAFWLPESGVVVLQPLAGGARVLVPKGFPPNVKAVAAGQRFGEVVAAALTADQRSLVVVQRDGGSDLVDLSTSKTRSVVPDPNAPVMPKASRIQAAVATGELTIVADAESVVVRDATTGAVIRELEREGVRRLAHVRDDVLIQFESGALEVWDERLTGRKATIAGDSGFVWTPAGNGTLVARARDNHEISVSDVATGSTVATFPGESSRKVGIAFSGDGRWLVTLAEPANAGDSTAVVRDMSDEALVKAACTTAGRDLTTDEWRAMVDSAVPDDLACR